MRPIFCMVLEFCSDKDVRMRLSDIFGAPDHEETLIHFVNVLSAPPHTNMLTRL